MKQPTSSAAGHVQLTPIDNDSPVNQPQQDEVMDSPPPTPGHVQLPTIYEQTEVPVVRSRKTTPTKKRKMKQPIPSAGDVQLFPLEDTIPMNQPRSSDEFIIPVSAFIASSPNLPNTKLFDLGRRDEYIEYGIPLYKASFKGDWKTAQVILEKKPQLVRWSITETGETPLHVAVTAAKETKQMKHFVINLVKMMTKKDLELQNKSFNTALCLAATAGNVEMVKILVEKNPALMKIPGSQQRMPLYMAALFGQRDVMSYLYDKSKRLRADGWTHQNRGWLLLKCVEVDLFDIALQILVDRPELVSYGSVLGVLARKPDAFAGKSSKIFACDDYEEFPEKNTEALRLLRIIWHYIAQKPKPEIDDILRGPRDEPMIEDRPPYGKEDQTLHQLKLITDYIVKIPVETHRLTEESSRTINRVPSILGNAKETYSSRILFVAAKMGNTNFIVELIQKYPDLIWKVNDHNQSIFHIAVIHRHEGIYNLLYEIGSMKDLVTPLKDDNGNNMLHLVGKIAKKKRLQDVSGVALQMRLELLWFKEVESMIPPSYREHKNKDGLTPNELFTLEHKDLVAQGEKWMKGTSSQCMVVAALIATIVFAAALTVPGGYIQDNGNKDNGIPVFHSKVTFMVFVVADGISLFSSSASILMFLSIITSRYAERDFLQSLHKKLMFGLATLFLSITTMTVAFCVSFFILYDNGLVWMPIVISMFAVLPIFLFAWLQYPLLADMRTSLKPSRGVVYFKDHKLKPFLKGLFHNIKSFRKGLVSKFKR